MPFVKGVRASPATEFKPGQSGNPDGRPVQERVAEPPQNASRSLSRSSATDF